ncbi:lysozyme inhibitor LprI family protein [Herbaspirillum sp. RV1423]|uniref:lysozyme inhibitor LprI family protein n=1 Tax=Herbaspirillum sp. RV1423 TaxID=1443993 RepID=UPI0012DE7C15|nr:hypothetical protein [Herbaspirillum sp. RV1423]
MSQIQRIFASAAAPFLSVAARPRNAFFFYLTDRGGRSSLPAVATGVPFWKRAVLLASLLAGSAATPAFGASFHCSNAGSATEKIICGDAELSRLDDQLGKTYRQAKAKAADRREFAARSDGFWRWREKNCQTRECLLDWYRQRQLALEAELSGINAAPTALQSLPAQASTAPDSVQAVTPEQVRAALAQVQKLIVEPDRGNHLFLVDDAPQPARAVPLQAHYVRVVDGEYVYEDPNEATSLDARPEVLVRYRGKLHGEYTLEVRKKTSKLRYTCDSDCAYIKQLMLPGYGLHDLDMVRNDHTSLASIMMRDAINGLLLESE